MTKRIGVNVRHVAGLVFFGMALTWFVLSAAGATQPVAALAYNCSPGYQSSQQDNWNGRGHAWLGYCFDWTMDIKHYTGADWGGTTLSWQQVHLRVWECGKLLYDNTYKTYNTKTISLNSGWWWNLCGPQSDVSGSEGVNGQFSWSWYMHY
jgi:hypothetical protein